MAGEAGTETRPAGRRAPDWRGQRWNVAVDTSKIKQLREERQNIRIEVEADDLEQVRAFVEIPEIDVILLDNMAPAQIREAVALKTDNIKFEASGGITLKNVNRIAATGVDYISVGSLTHGARAIDIGLEMTHVPR